MMFASKALPDSGPYRYINNSSIRRAQPLEGLEDKYVYDPREHDASMNNESNPILSHAREASVFSAVSWLDAFDAFGGFVSWPDDHPVLIASPEQRDHARKVLSRLAAAQ